MLTHTCPCGGRCLHTLSGHHGEISSTQFNFSGDLCISGSIDRTCKIWEMGSGKCVTTLRGHNDEILDVCFNSTGNKVRARRCCDAVPRACVC